MAKPTGLRPVVASLVVAVAATLLSGVSGTSAQAAVTAGDTSRSAARASASVGTAHAQARRERRQERLRAERRRVAAQARQRAARAAQVAANPLSAQPWGVYKGSGDQAWAPYARSSGQTKQLLAKIALRPKAKWFGDWIPENQVQKKVRAYVANASGGNPGSLVQLTVFNLKPWEHDACRRLPTASEQAHYKRWVDAFARGVGAQRTALILQPDGPFATCTPGGSTVPSQLIAYAAKRFSALPRTAVYIDGGAADWPYRSSSAAVDFLVRDGIAYTRGVALNSTHYSATGDEVERGTAIVTELARRGITGKHVVVNTSSNGRPFVFGDAPGNDPDNATVCASRTSVHCVTLGIPPTTDVANARWGLTEAQRAHARQYVDGYLWFGRPWLYRQADPFLMGRALQLVRTSPF